MKEEGWTMFRSGSMLTWRLLDMQNQQLVKSFFFFLRYRTWPETSGCLCSVFPIHASNPDCLHSSEVVGSSGWAVTHPVIQISSRSSHPLSTKYLHKMLPLHTASEVPCALSALVVGCAMLFWLPSLWTGVLTVTLTHLFHCWRHYFHFYQRDHGFPTSALSLQRAFISRVFIQIPAMATFYFLETFCPISC